MQRISLKEMWGDYLSSNLTLKLDAPLNKLSANNYIGDERRSRHTTIRKIRQLAIVKARILKSVKEQLNQDRYTETDRCFDYPLLPLRIVPINANCVKHAVVRVRQEVLSNSVIISTEVVLDAHWLLPVVILSSN